MPINANANFEELSVWLNENLTDKNRIKACCEQVKNVPETKGIYFWFMHPDGYNALNIKPIEPKYKRDINGIKYDLVYLGTAGVRNNSNGINNGHLKERLKWHLCDNKGITGLCSGTMSTYRRTVGGLISDDLIANNTQDKIDELLCKYFLIYYVEYPGAFLNVKDQVNSDEDILIDVIRPILNLDKNPNAKNPKHITYTIQQKRQLVESESKKKWCNDNQHSESKEYNGPLVANNNPGILNNNEGCIEFLVKQNQSAHERIQNFYFFKNTKYSIVIFETLNPANFICTNYNFSKTPTKYFGRNDTNPDRQIDNREPKRWEVINKEMIENKIAEVTISLCPVENILIDNNKINS